MTNIQQARETVMKFLKESLGVDKVRVIGVKKLDNGWETEAEIYEENSFLKSLGLPTRVQDRNIYIVKLDDSLEVQSYERQQEHVVMSD